MNKEIKEMNLEERVDDYISVDNEKEFSTALEYFYSTLFAKDGRKGAMEEIEDYYSSILYDQANNGTVGKVYAFTNEKLSALFSELELKDCRVATVGSSGDQAILSIYNGAKEVDLIDGNILTQPFVELKLSAIKNLSHTEFLDFSTHFSRKLAYDYGKISHDLSKKSQVFWDNLILDGQERKFHHFIHSWKDIENVYRTEESYNKLQDYLNNKKYKINYITSEFENFPQKLNGKYDLILLSNICDYFNDTNSSKGPQEFIDVVKKLFENNLSEIGAMQVSSRREEFYLLRLARKLKANRKNIKGAGIRYYTGSEDYHSSVMYGKKNSLYDEMRK